MGLMRSAMAVLLGTALLAGCGGGGGSSAGAGADNTAPVSNGVPAVTPGGSWLTLTPGTVSLSSFPGEDLRFQVNARSSRMFDKPFNVAVVDSKGVVATDLRLNKISELEYTVDLRTNALTPGVHTTNLQVRLCEDDPLTCSKPLPGSPWYLPVSVNVASDAQAKERLKLAPLSFELVTYEGVPLSFELELAPTVTFTREVWVGIYNNNGMLSQKGTAVLLNPNGKLRVPLETASSLAAGEHAGALEVRLCYDFPQECRAPVGGSPWSVPLKLSVKSHTNLTPLSVMPSLSSWNTLNANATQNAYVPAAFSAAAFTGRWTRPQAAGVLRTSLVVENGRVFTVEVNGAKRDLVAISEANGQELWRHDLSAASGAGALATGNGRVFVRSTEQDSSFLRAIDQASGQLLSKTRTNGPFEFLAAPTVVGDMVYLGHSKGMEKVDAATGQIAWSNLGMNTMAPFWTPTVDAGRAYTVLGEAFFGLDTADGSIASTFRDPDLSYNSFGIKPLVLSGKLGVVASGARLAAYDMQASTRNWLAETSTIGAPVLANASVYTLGTDRTVEARSAATGVLQWKSAPVFTQAEFSNARIVATSNLLFVSAMKMTLALDLATRQVVWTYPGGGDVAISDRGVLYIVVASNGRMTAINLR